jgi:hypothetical protein
MASGLTPLKRFIIRSTLVVGSTVATIVGAETLATLDVKQAPLPTSLSASPSSPVSAVSIVRPPIVGAPPTIVIIRHPPVEKAPTVPNVVVPKPSVIQAPAPIIVQQPQIVVQAPGGSQPQAVPQVPSQPTTQSTR